MADSDLKWEENEPGPYYVDQNCIAAKYCLSVAPDNFRMEEGGGHAYVCRQPSSPEEEEAVRDAVSGCPVNAVGDDGESA
jgi:ferredoxin